MKKIFIYLLIFLLICGCFGSDSYAEEVTPTDTDSIVEDNTSISTEKYDEKKGIVNIRLMFCTDTGARDIIKSGTAFFVGSGSDKYLVSTCDSVILTDEEKAAVANSHGVEIDKVNTAIELVLRDDIIVDLSIVNSSEILNFAILQPSGNLGDFTTIRLCENSNVFNKGSVLHTYDQNFNQVDCTIEDWAEIDDSHFFRYSCEVDIPIGYPLMNDEGEVVAIISSKNKGNIEEKYALQIDEIIDVFNKLGLPYNQDIVVNIEELENVISEYESLEKKDYTSDSWIKCEKSYENAKKVLERIKEGDINYYSQDEVDVASGDLSVNLQSLEKKGISVKTVLIISIIIISTLIIIIIILVVMIIRNEKRFERRLKEETDKAAIAMEALRAGDRITPGLIPNTTNRSIGSLSGIPQINDSNYETTVLIEGALTDSTGFKEIRINPILIRRKTGERISINQNSFVIGSIKDSVDYCISDNTNISRKHACIMKLEDGYYIQDMNTTNGTFVNDMRVMPERYIKLESGSVIRMAEEEFDYKEE